MQRYETCVGLAKCQFDDGPMKPIPFVSARLTPSALSKALIGFIALVCISLVFATSWQLKHSSTERLANAKMAVSNIVRAAEQQAQDTIRQADNILRDMAERVEHDGTGVDQQPRLIKLMSQYIENTEGIQGLFIYDAQGKWVANSFSQSPEFKNNSDRAYFIYHRDNPDPSIHLGPIIESRATGKMVIPISRRINYPDGSFAGVALATIPVSHFLKFFERMDVDDKGVIFLALDTGDLLARRPTLAALMTTNVSKGDIFSRYLPRSDSGTAVIKSVVDGVERVYAYRRLSGLPIVAAAGISCDYVFAPWWQYAYRSFAMIGIIIFALAVLGTLLYRQIQQLLVAERELNIARNELEIIAQTDSLTSLANRRSFDAALQKEWGRANRNQSGVAVILLDIDWFKQFNDQYGHLHGDECLKEVARLVRQSVSRTTDLAARFGGEEFVILLPETDLAGALSVAESVRLSIAQARIEHSASPLGMITISAGVVASQAPAKDSYKEALAEADRLLYCAKSQGRNCVEGRVLQPRHLAAHPAETSAHNRGN
jgi:diguanylate cyclase (GGDEF)-like protein